MGICGAAESRALIQDLYVEVGAIPQLKIEMWGTRLRSLARLKSCRCYKARSKCVLHQAVKAVPLQNKLKMDSWAITLCCLSFSRMHSDES